MRIVEWAAVALGKRQMVQVTYDTGEVVRMYTHFDVTAVNTPVPEGTPVPEWDVIVRQGETVLDKGQGIDRRTP